MAFLQIYRNPILERMLYINFKFKFHNTAEDSDAF